MGVGRAPSPCIFTHDTNEVEGGLIMVLFFSLIYSIKFFWDQGHLYFNFHHSHIILALISDKPGK